MFLLEKTSVHMPLLCAVALFCTACDDVTVAKSSGVSAEPEAIQQADDVELTKLNGETMGTYWHVTIADPVEDQKNVLEEIKQVLLDVNQDMSTYIPDSAISQFNRQQDSQPRKISEAFMQNILAAYEISEASNGVYDITIGPLVNLWGFGPDKIAKPPTQEEIDTALAKVGYKQLQIDRAAGTIAKSNPEMMIDLSSIAKGYGVDALSTLLEHAGYRNYLVDIGGELLAKGSKQGQPWRVAIEQPVDGRHVQQVIMLNQDEGMQTALATSGNYRNFVDYENERVVHTIDPRTGRSSQSRLLSVTVIAKNCMYADGYATAMMALGADDAEDFARQQEIAAMFIYAADEGKSGCKQTRKTR